MVGVKNYLADISEAFKHFKWYEHLMMAVMFVIAAYSLLAALVRPESSPNPPWLAAFNFISALCGILCVFFNAKAHTANFLFGIINTLAYAVYLGYWKIYGTLSIELFVYLPIGIISWIHWNNHRESIGNNIAKAKKMTWYQYLLSAAMFCVLALVSHSVLVKLNGETIWLDAMTVSLGLVATMLQMLRYREQYVYWLLNDVVAVAMFIQHFDPVYLTKKTIYLIMAIIGLINWVKLSRKNTSNE